MDTMKILIWGTGNTAERVLSDGVNGDIVGFIRSEPGMDTFHGKPVYLPDSIGVEYDVIYVASVYVIEIYDKIQKCEIPLNKVCWFTIPPFFDVDIENNLKLVRAILGTKNNKVINECIWRRDNPELNIGPFCINRDREARPANRMERFGVRQRCLESKQYLVELLLLSGHYDHDVNFYIYEGDFHFLGTINRKVLCGLNTSPQICSTMTVGEVCKNEEIDCSNDVAWYGGETPLIETLYNAFESQFRFSDELALIDSDTGRLIGIYDRKEVYNARFALADGSDAARVCCRELSHYYKPSMGGLNQYARAINSQNGEDGIIEEIFNRIGTTSKYAVEFGGWDGIFLSNIRYLITDKGFGGLFIEGEEERAKNLIKNYEDYPNVQCVSAYVGFQGEFTLDNILRTCNAPKEIDLISIDIDGYDYQVWNALQIYRPRVIVIEYNPIIPNDVIFINPKDESVHCCSSAAALVGLGRRKKYSLVAVTACNLIFVADEEYEKLQIWDNDLDVLRYPEEINDGRYFQTFDGHILLTGFVTHLWKGQNRFSPEDPLYFVEI